MDKAYFLRKLYLNKVRSSRGLARECERNVELWWLLKGLRPKYPTIAAFRADHPKALQNVFRQFVSLLDQCTLLGKETLALDGIKFRAQNSKKKNYNFFPEGLQKVNGEMALIFQVYNLRRSMSILGTTGLIKALKRAFLAFIWLWRSMKQMVRKAYHQSPRVFALPGYS